MKFLIAILVVISASTSSFAHEGHDEGSSLTPKKGGVAKSLEKTVIEVVAKGKDLKIYFYDKEMKSQDLKGYKISAQVEPPRSKKREDLPLKIEGSIAQATYDAKGLHRYTLILSVTDPKTGHDDKLNFTIEPRK